MIFLLNCITYFKITILAYSLENTRWISINKTLIKKFRIFNMIRYRL